MHRPTTVHLKPITDPHPLRAKTGALLFPADLYGIDCITGSDNLIVSCVRTHSVYFIETATGSVEFLKPVIRSIRRIPVAVAIGPLIKPAARMVLGPTPDNVTTRSDIQRTPSSEQTTA